MGCTYNIYPEICCHTFFTRCSLGYNGGIRRRLTQPVGVCKWSWKSRATRTVPWSCITFFTWHKNRHSASYLRLSVTFTPCRHRHILLVLPSVHKLMCNIHLEFLKCAGKTRPATNRQMWKSKNWDVASMFSRLPKDFWNLMRMIMMVWISSWKI